MITYFLLVIGVTNSLLEYIQLGDTKINYTLSTYLLSAIIYLSINYGFGKLVGEAATALSLFWAVFNFIRLNNKQRRIALKISILPIFLWILFNLARGAMPYYSTIALLLIIIYLSGRKLPISPLIQIADPLTNGSLKIVKLLIHDILNTDSQFRDTIVVCLLSVLLFFSASGGLSELVGKIAAVFVASWAILNLPELTEKQRRLTLKTYLVLLFLWVLFNLAINSISSYSAVVLLAVLTIFLFPEIKLHKIFNRIKS
jgi:hypothetical protein